MYCLVASAIVGMSWLGHTEAIPPDKVVPIMAALGMGMLSMGLLHAKDDYAEHFGKCEAPIYLLFGAGVCWGADQINDTGGLLVAMGLNFSLDAYYAYSYTDIVAGAFDNMSLAYLLGDCTTGCAHPGFHTWGAGVLYIVCTCAGTKLSNNAMPPAVSTGVLIGTTLYTVVAQLGPEMASSAAWVEGVAVLVGFGVAPLVYLGLKSWEKGTPIDVHAIRTAVAVIYAGYAVAIVLGIVGSLPLRTVLIVCLGAHFIGLLYGSVIMDDIEPYPKELEKCSKHVLTAVIVVDMAQFIALGVVIFANLTDLWLTGFAALALVGVAFCAYKLWVTWPKPDRMASNGDTLSVPPHRLLTSPRFWC